MSSLLLPPNIYMICSRIKNQLTSYLTSQNPLYFHSTIFLSSIQLLLLKLSSTDSLARTALICISSILDLLIGLGLCLSSSTNFLSLPQEIMLLVFLHISRFNRCKVCHQCLIHFCLYLQKCIFFYRVIINDEIQYLQYMLQDLSLQTFISNSIYCLEFPLINKTPHCFNFLPCPHILFRIFVLDLLWFLIKL
jgi:hypothetical protein